MRPELLIPIAQKTDANKLTCISQGSKNYEIIGKLVERGATLMKTEDLALVKQEYAHIAKIAHAKSPKEKEAWDLGEGETGILFIGVHHEILSRLSGDVEFVTVKGQI